MQINNKKIVEEIIKTRDGILASEPFNRANALNKELSSLLKKIEKHNRSNPDSNKIVGFKQDLGKVRKAVNNYWLTAPKSKIKQASPARLRKILHSLLEDSDNLLDDIPILASWCKRLKHRLSLKIINKKTCPIMRTSLPRFRYWKNLDDN